MKTFFSGLLRIVCVAIILPGCSSSPNPSREDYKITVRDGIKSVPHVDEILRMFPGAPTDHFITHFGFSYKPVTWNTEVFFGGRYELTYQVEVQVSYKENRITRVVGTPTFYLSENVSITPLGDGRFETRYGPGNHSFGEAEWAKVVAANGDFSVIGFQLNTNSPLPDFDAYVRAVRAGRRLEN